MQIKVVIPAKGDSVRVPRKNLRPFYQDQSLLEICIEKVKTLGLPVVVNSESYEVLALATKLGVNTQQRPATLSTPETTPRVLARYIAEANADADFILYVHCTNPLIGVEHFRSAIELPLERWKTFDSLNSAYLVQKHLWRKREPMYDTENRPPTQGLRDFVALEYSVNLISQVRMMERSDFIGSNPAFIIVPHDQVVDIDEEIDFEIAQDLYARRLRGTQT